MLAKAKIAITVLLMISTLSGVCFAGADSYKAKMKRAKAAFEQGDVFEAQRWTQEALEMKPGDPQAQSLMAKIFDKQIEQDIILSQQDEAPEELPADDKKLKVKTLLERSNTLLQMNLLKEANDTAEQALQLDPDNLEASRLLDTIKETAQKQGREESLFLQQLYEEETHSRIESYTEQAESWIAQKKWGAARIALEKVLVLDPDNKRAKKLLDHVDKQGDQHWSSTAKEFASPR